jgi:hypothetical protein
MTDVAAVRRGRPRPEYTLERDRIVAAVLADGEKYTVAEVTSRIFGMDEKQVFSSLNRLKLGDGTARQALNERVFRPVRGYWQATEYALTYDSRFGGTGEPRRPTEYPTIVVRLKTPEELAGAQLQMTPETLEPELDSEEAATTATWQ